MSPPKDDRVELIQGTLDMLILQTLLLAPAHGHHIAKHLQQITDDVLQVEHGSLYPALHRLQRRKWITSKWETPKGGNRELKIYRLTALGKRQLTREEAKWNKLTAAIARVMRPAKT